MSVVSEILFTRYKHEQVCCQGYQLAQPWPDFEHIRQIWYTTIELIKIKKKYKKNTEKK